MSISLGLPEKRCKATAFFRMAGTAILIMAGTIVAGNIRVYRQTAGLLMVVIFRMAGHGQFRRVSPLVGHFVAVPSMTVTFVSVCFVASRLVAITHNQEYLTTKISS